MATPIDDETAAWRQRAYQAEEEKKDVARAATGTTWKLRHALKRAEARIRELEAELRAAAGKGGDER